MGTAATKADGNVAQAMNTADALDSFEAAISAGVNVTAMLAAQAARMGGVSDADD